MLEQELSDDEIAVLKAIAAAITGSPKKGGTVDQARKLYTGVGQLPSVLGGIDAVLTFRKFLLSLHEKGYVSLPDSSRPELPSDTVIRLTAAGWATIDGH